MADTAGAAATQSAQWQTVEDEVNVEDEEGDYPYIRHTQLKFTKQGKLTSACRRQLAAAGLQHHVLGRSFP